jgi:hypothetical protein
MNKKNYALKSLKRIFVIQFPLVHDKRYFHITDNKFNNFRLW